MEFFILITTPYFDFFLNKNVACFIRFHWVTDCPICPHVWCVFLHPWWWWLRLRWRWWWSCFRQLYKMSFFETAVISHKNAPKYPFKIKFGKSCNCWRLFDFIFAIYCQRLLYMFILFVFCVYIVNNEYIIYKFNSFE